MEHFVPCLDCQHLLKKIGIVRLSRGPFPLFDTLVDDRVSLLSISLVLAVLQLLNAPINTDY